ncbi:hypothetical protein D3C84_753940 [compost metagenome]
MKREAPGTVWSGRAEGEAEPLKPAHGGSVAGIDVIHQVVVAGQHPLHFGFAHLEEGPGVALDMNGTDKPGNAD